MSKEIILRAPEPEDLDFMLECENDEAAAFWSDYAAPFSRHLLAGYLLNYDADPFNARQLRLVASLSFNSPFALLDLYDISSRDLSAVVGITIHPAFRGKRLAVRALEALSNYAFKRLGLVRLAAKVSTRNITAAKVFKKAGYQELAILPQWHRMGSEFHDFHLFINSPGTSV